MILRTIRILKAARAAARDVADGYLDLQLDRLELVKLRAAVFTLKADLDAAEYELVDLRAEVKRLRRLSQLRGLASNMREILSLVVSGGRRDQPPEMVYACSELIRKLDAIIPASEGR